MIVTNKSHRTSRETASEDDFKAQSAYQNKILFKQQAEKLNNKSFLQNVHENSRKVKNAMLDNFDNSTTTEKINPDDDLKTATPYDFYGKQ